MNSIEELVPTGIGKKGRHRGTISQLFEDVVHEGAEVVVAAGFGRQDDLEVIEESGYLAGAALKHVRRRAVKRGTGQLGTLGGGNHFIEIQRVEQVFDELTAEKFGIFEGQLAVMIHTGSRGFGHQICTDYSRSQVEAAAEYGIELPDKGLACAPVESPAGRNYYAAMACAVNFAFANRQVITADIRQAFGQVLKMSENEMGLEVVYDVAHNIAKWENHRGQRLLVHRKGATRALPPGHPDNPPAYRDTGHPVLVPGSMGTASYVLVEPIWPPNPSTRLITGRVVPFPAERLREVLPGRSLRRVWARFCIIPGIIVMWWMRLRKPTKISTRWWIRWPILA